MALQFVELVNGQCDQWRGARGNTHKRMTNRINLCNDSDSKTEIIENFLRRWLEYELIRMYKYDFDVVVIFLRKVMIYPLLIYIFFTHSGFYISKLSHKQFWNNYFLFLYKAFSLLLY